MTDTKRLLRVFLCHASGDKSAVKELYDRLVSDGIDAWLDKEKLIPGQDWEIEIPKAVKDSDVVIVCLSSQSVTKEGYVQKEIKFALDIANEKPYGTIFIIPARLENCEVPEQIRKYHWVDLFSSDGYELLTKALQLRANNLGIIVKRKKNAVNLITDENISNTKSALQDLHLEPQNTNKPFLKRKSLYRRVYEYLIEHWFVTLLLASSPAWWFTFVELFGKNLGLVIDDKFTSSTSSILYSLFIISYLFIALMTLSNRYNERAIKMGQEVLSIILESVNAIKYAKLRRFIKFINTNHGRRGGAPFIELTQPLEQIESILVNMQIALSQIFGISRDDISLSLIYKTERKPTWQWLYTINCAPDLELGDLIKNSHSTIRQIIDGHADFLLFPNKNTGIQKNQYVNEKKDSLHKGIGSILCKNISLETNEKSIQAILSISTYGLQLCSENDFIAIESITDFFLPPFERRIQLELGMLYIKEMTTPK